MKLYHLIPLSLSQNCNKKFIMEGFDHESIDSFELIPTLFLFGHGVEGKCEFTSQTGMLDHASIYIDR